MSLRRRSVRKPFFEAIVECFNWGLGFRDLGVEGFRGLEFRDLGVEGFRV